MADDIVTRLRTVDEFSDAIGIMNKAADEIERLRAAGDALADDLEGIGDDGAAIVLSAWREARRA